ncbi:hypothetical protein DR62_07345 [Burkholderia thailandensis]|nr:hypothetical protein DR62_07345 [Burkholderia thailandensis]AOI54734.1 hypothetical protein WI24_23265 [Burkholderia thailandensis]AVR28029.1 hypothetical protein A8H32_24030 [Burkholderia thailandensis]
MAGRATPRNASRRPSGGPPGDVRMRVVFAAWARPARVAAAGRSRRRPAMPRAASPRRDACAAARDARRQRSGFAALNSTNGLLPSASA